MTTKWRYADNTNTVVLAVFDDGHSESHLVTAACIQAWLADGNTPLPYEPPVPSPEELKATLKAAAQNALDKSDVTLLRCYERGVSVPTEWADYRAALRAIVGGTSEATELPVRPEYPV